MVRDIHDYDSLKEAYGALLMFERFPGPVRSERVENFVIQLKRDIREYVNRVSDCHIIRDELDSFVELVKLPEKLSPLSKESVLEWFYMHRAYRDDRYDGMGSRPVSSLPPASGSFSVAVAGTPIILFRSICKEVHMEINITYKKPRARGRVPV